jgi:DNA-binding response OmpR family regulator
MPEILIVDDEPQLRFIVGDILKKEGYEIREANGGTECLEVLGKERPDLILLDVMMPDMNGWQVIQEIGKMQDPVPVVMLTVVREPDTLIPEELQVIVDYINKPFKRNELIERVNRAVEIIEAKPQ